MLVITGRKAENRNKDGNYLHVGIATRAFERRFELADFVRVEDADLPTDCFRSSWSARSPRR